jgi:hypothetical protein
MTQDAARAVATRVRSLNWEQLERDFDECGYATTPPLLDAQTCHALAGMYGDGKRFRSHIDMARYRFGVGDYKYFDDPLPSVVQALRTSLYPPLARIANRWATQLSAGITYPEELGQFLDRCAKSGQTKPTPLLLHYQRNGYNCLHQDLYGEVAFPLQVTVLLSRPEADFIGGEFLLVEQRPRAQSRGEAIVLGQGEAVLFPTRERPISGSRGYYRAAIRHGVSRVRSGTRYTLGVIFHNAK